MITRIMDRTLIVIEGDELIKDPNLLAQARKLYDAAGPSTRDIMRRAEIVISDRIRKSIRRWLFQWEVKTGLIDLGGEG